MSIDPRAARRELQRRVRAVLAHRRETEWHGYKEAIKRHIFASLTPRQQSVLKAIADLVRFISLCCSRRAGKTYLLACLIILTLLDAGFNQAVFFVAPTADIGKDLIWAEVERLHDMYNLGWKLSKREGEITTPYGASFHVIGLDDRKQTGKTRGYDMVMCLCDETQEYEHLLKAFITATAPALAQRKGVFIAAGTPGVALRGYWWGLCQGTTPQERQGFVNFEWDLGENTKLARPAEEIWQEELERNGWTPDHPTFQREWNGKWVEDHNFLVVEYAAARNAITAMPEEYASAWTEVDGKRRYVGNWRHVIGLDYGFNDAFAMDVLAVDPYSLAKYFVFAWKKSRLTYDEAADELAEVAWRFHCSHAACDPAGGGLPFYQTFNRRYGAATGLNVASAHKVAGSLVESVRFQNTELRQGRLFVLLPDAQPLADEWGVLRWKDEWRDEILKSAEYPDDAFDAGRYALMETITWQPKERPASMNDAERLERELRKSIERQAAQDRSPMSSLRNRWG